MVVCRMRLVREVFGAGQEGRQHRSTASAARAEVCHTSATTSGQEYHLVTIRIVFVYYR
jgi:hypothetical protein